MGQSGRKREFVLVGVLLILVGVLLGVVLARWDLGEGRIDWGTGGEWAGAILTAIVLLVAVLALRSEREQTTEAIQEARRANDSANAANAREADRWQRDQEDREREQAARVGCYYQALHDSTITLRCRNDSTSLIYDVQPFAIHQGVETRGAVGVVEARLQLPPAGGPRLEPNSEVTFTMSLQVDGPLATDPKHEIWTQVLVPNAYGVTFADNTGRWWRKWGSLELEADPAAAQPFERRTPTTERGRLIARGEK